MQNFKEKTVARWPIVRHVAEYLLSLSDPDAGDFISHLKLQKLLYYTQGFYLGVTSASTPDVQTARQNLAAVPHNGWLALLILGVVHCRCRQY